jgi:hypothetical protein
MFLIISKNIDLMGLVGRWQILCEKVLNKTFDAVDGASFSSLSADEVTIINN